MYQRLSYGSLLHSTISSKELLCANQDSRHKGMTVNQLDEAPVLMKLTFQ